MVYYTTIRIEDDVHERLRQEGRKQDTYSAIIKRLLEELDGYRAQAKK